MKRFFIVIGASMGTFYLGYSELTTFFALGTGANIYGILLLIIYQAYKLIEK